MISPKGRDSANLDLSYTFKSSVLEKSLEISLLNLPTSSLPSPGFSSSFFPWKYFCWNFFLYKLVGKLKLFSLQIIERVTSYQPRPGLKSHLCARPTFWPGSRVITAAVMFCTGSTRCRLGASLVLDQPNLSLP